MIRLVLSAIAAWAVAAAAAEVPVKKWRPGHYMYQWGAVAAADDLALPGVAGVHIRVPWRAIERVAGIYDMSALRLELAKARDAGKYLSVALEDKSWKAKTAADAKCVPDDLLADPAAQGAVVVEQASNGTFTCTPKRWVPAVSQRWFRLLGAVGSALDREPALAMVQSTESAGKPFVASAVQSAYCQRLQDEARAFATAFPTTPWAVSLNWGVPQQSCRDSLVALIADLGGGISHPDSVPPAGQGNPFEPFFESYRGRIVSAPAQEMTFVSGSRHISEYDCGGRSCGWPDMLTLMDRWGANFVYWNRTGWGSKTPVFDFRRDMLPLLKARDFPVARACPANIRCDPAFVPIAAPENHRVAH